MFKTSWYVNQWPQLSGCGWWVWHTWGRLGILDGPRSADSHLYWPPLEGASICAIGREAQQNGLMVRATSTTALFPCAGPSPHLLQLLPTSLWTTNDHKEQTNGECFKTKRRFQYSLTYSICSRMNDMQLGSCSSGCHFWEKIKSDTGRWRGGKAAESGVSTEMM